MDAVIIPADHELVGTFPGQMPDATWAEIMAWFEENGMDPERCPATREIVITDTITRWETPDGSVFGKGPTRADGVELAAGEQWSHDRPDSQHTQRPVRLVTSPVSTPLPDHLRVAIAKAVAGEDLPDGLRTPVEWCRQFAIELADRVGWDDGQSWHEPVTEAEFTRRASMCKIREVPLTPEQESRDILHRLLTGQFVLEPGA